MKRTPAALWIWYRGTDFRGFQRQPEGATVQEALDIFGVAEAPERTAEDDGDDESGDDGAIPTGEDTDEESMGILDRIIASLRSMFS